MSKPEPVADSARKRRSSIAGPLPADSEFWVFGYASLMWKPGFEFEERRRGILRGFHRSLCVYSNRHRGTAERPGLVMGLDRGGSCRGMAFRIAREKVEATHAYLTEREQINRVYFEVYPRVRLEDGRAIRALAYVVDRNHVQYAGRLAHAEILRLIAQGHGQSGACRDYVLNTLRSMAEIGMTDHALDWLERELSAR
ncbi:MAG: gamma-glutamylcyclotransferase [Methylobacterium sp.]|nr:gamma-glutamylcyclotransferase [Methylobacterium sp.]